MPTFTPTSLTPTQEQLNIQRAPEKTILVQANAGAAKTTTLALKIAQALTERTPPEHILVLTYTEPACVAMRSALSKIGLEAPTISRLRIQTFEQFAAQVLLGIEKTRVPLKTTPEDLATVVTQALEALDLSVAGEHLTEHFLKLATQLKGTLARDLILWNDQTITPEQCDQLGVDHALMRLFGAYERIRYPEGDHCDRPHFRGPFDATYDLAKLLAHPQTSTPIEEIPSWPHRIQHLLVDEMHDLNLATFTLLSHLLQTTPAYFCGVGDLDQVVFSLAGAQACYMSPDVNLGPQRQVKTYPLTASRRFGASLAQAAGRLAGKPYAHECAHLTHLLCSSYEHPTDCAEQVLAIAQDWQKTHARQMNGLAILLRHPYQSVHIENALLRAKLPYQNVGFKSYLLQPEVLLVRAVLALHAQGFHSFSSEKTRKELVAALVFFCNVQLQFAGSDQLSSTQRLTLAIDTIAADASLLPIFFEQQVLRRGEPRLVRRLQNAILACQHTGPQMLQGVLDALEINTWAYTVFVEKQRCFDTQAYMQGLLDAAASFANAQAFFEHLSQSEHQINNEINDTRSARINKQKNTVRQKKNLVLSTVAQAKGLEFDHVVIPRLRQGEFPAQLSRSAIEERNLFYVGITRAQQHLTLLVDRHRPSELVAQAGLGPHDA